jgi:hypothetical protein
VHFSINLQKHLECQELDDFENQVLKWPPTHPTVYKSKAKTKLQIFAHFGREKMTKTGFFPKFFTRHKFLCKHFLQIAFWLEAEQNSTLLLIFLTAIFGLKFHL